MIFIYLSMLENEEDRKKIAEIYEENKLFCIHIANKVTNNLEYAEDAVHNAFVEVIKRKEKMIVLSNSVLRATLVIIVKNKAIDILREKKKIACEPVEDLEYLLHSNEVQIDELLSANEEYEILRKALEKLGDIHKNILRMKYFDNLSNTEIAQILGITNKHVETRIYRAKETLKKSLKEGC